MKPLKQSRRRFIGIMATAGAIATTPWAMRNAMAKAESAAGSSTAGTAAAGFTEGGAQGAGSGQLVSWRGIALGANAELHIYHPDRAFAQMLVERSIAEVHRLERVFSLYRDDSALVRLNRDGRLDNAPTDMLRLLQESHSYSRMTAGAFDPSVQPLWTLYADAAIEARKRAARRPAFATPIGNAGTPAGETQSEAPSAGTTTFGRISESPSAADLAQVLRLVDYRAIEIDGRSIRLARPGMALTLNGIAQGYITDRVTELLLDAGLKHALVDMGEIRGTQSAPGDRPWRVGLAGDHQDGSQLETIEMRDRAISTSSRYGTMFDADGALTHLFDPRTGTAHPRYRSVSVMAGNATTADALSTAFSLMTEAEIRRLAEAMKLQVWLLREGEARLAHIT